MPATSRKVVVVILTWRLEEEGLLTELCVFFLWKNFVFVMCECYSKAILSLQNRA
jgi:hypothetical protein